MIRVQNVYYMLAYAFQVLHEQGYKNVATEEFDNVAELLAAILCRGVSVQIKRGLIRQYLPQPNHQNNNGIAASWKYFKSQKKGDQEVDDFL